MKSKTAIPHPALRTPHSDAPPLPSVIRHLHSAGLPPILLAHFARIAEAPDAIPRLRQFILDLAVRGKLVSQDLRDEPAAELLTRIQAHKKRLIEQGSLRKQAPPAPLASEELPFEAPHGWAWARLTAVSNKIHYGYTASANASIKNVRLLRITDIQDNKVDWDSVPGCDISPDDVHQYKLTAGDILIARTGGTIGKTFLVKLIPVTAVFASYLIRVQPAPDLNIAFLKLFLESPVYWKQLQDGSRGGGQPNVNGQTLGRMAVTLPPLAEQHRIVAKVDELMALCDRLEAAQADRETRRTRLVAATHASLSDSALRAPHPAFFISALPSLTARPADIQQLRQTILNLAVRGKLVPQDPADEPASDLLQRIQAQKQRLIQEGKMPKQKTLRTLVQENTPYRIPSSWQWTVLGALVRTMTNGIYKPAGFYADGGVECLRMYNIKDGRINFDNTKRIRITKEEQETYGLAKGDFLVNRVNSKELVGKAAPIPPRNEPLIFESKNIRVRFVEAEGLPHYSNILFQTLFYRAIIEGHAKQACGQATVNQPQLAEMPFPLPPLAEQHRIVAKVDELMALCDRLEAQLTTTQTKSRRLLESTLHQALATP